MGPRSGLFNSPVQKDAEPQMLYSLNCSLASCASQTFSLFQPKIASLPPPQMLLRFTVRERKCTGGIMKHLRFTQKAAKGSSCLMNTW